VLRATTYGLRDTWPLMVQLLSSSDSWHAVYTHFLVLPTSMTWYQWKGGDYWGWEGNRRPGGK